MSELTSSATSRPQESVGVMKKKISQFLIGMTSGERLQANGIRLVTFLLFLWAAFSIDNFTSMVNLNAIMYSTAAIGIASVGMALITLSGNLFMLSMAATAAASTIVFASLLQFGVFPALIGVTLLGLLIGLIQGVLVGVLSINPIIGTIATASVISGGAALYSGGLTIVGDGDASWLGMGKLLSVIPNQLVLFIVFALLVHLVVERSRFGRELRLIGLNRTAAFIGGISVARVLVTAFLIAGVAAALAGGLFGATAGQGNLKLGAGLDFDAIAAVLVGGVSIRGGKGRVLDAAFGAVFLAIVSNVLLVKGLSFEIQLAVKGLVVLIAVVLGAMAVRMRGK